METDEAIRWLYEHRNDDYVMENFGCFIYEAVVSDSDGLEDIGRYVTDAMMDALSKGEEVTAERVFTAIIGWTPQHFANDIKNAMEEKL